MSDDLTHTKINNAFLGSPDIRKALLEIVWDAAVREVEIVMAKRGEKDPALAVIDHIAFEMETIAAAALSGDVRAEDVNTIMLATRFSAVANVAAAALEASKGPANA